MEFSRILIVFVVILMTWKETLSNQIHRENNLLERSKRYHESDHDDYLARVNSTKKEREKKHAPTEPTKAVNTGPKSRGTIPDLSLVNKVPAKTMMPQRKIIRINPLNVNNNNIRKTRKPYVLVVKNHNLEAKNKKEISKRNEILADQTSDIKEVDENVLVDQVISDTIVNETLASDPDKDLQKPLEENAQIKSEEPQTLKPKTQSKTLKKHPKSRKPSGVFNEDVNSKKVVLQDPDKHSKKYKPLITPETDSNNESKKEQEEIKNDVETVKEKIVEDEKITVDTSTTEDSQTNSIVTEADTPEPKIHPLLKAIQNDLSSNTIDKPNCKDEVEEFIQEVAHKSAFDLDSRHKLSEKTDNDHENEGLIIKNKKYEEIVEITRPTKVPTIDHKANSVQNSSPVAYNSYQAPQSNYYQELNKPEFNLDYQNYNAPDEQTIEQIDGSTVVSYNNYFKLPTTPNSNYNNYPYQMNTNRFGGYVPIRPGQTDGWTYNRSFENQAAADVQRTWKTWKNTEYYLQSKNALNDIGRERFINLLNQNNGDKIKYIQRRSF